MEKLKGIMQTTIDPKECILVKVPNDYTDAEIQNVYEFLNKNFENILILPNEIDIKNIDIEKLKTIQRYIESILIAKKMIDVN